jgi:poly(3-hydroxyalkanoate) synthetase/tellurite resistance protein
MIGQALESISKVSDFTGYMVDSLQRSVLYADIMRKRGNIYLEHLEKGQPPVLVFDYEIIVDGRDLERPVNYCLVKILDKNKKEKKESSFPKRPVIVIDPRAGHGPGIGGSKEDSEIGLALDRGHPVYFVMFFTNPVPNQTIADVQNAEVYFVEEVKKRHKGAENPAIVGNCQAGWAASLVAADRPDICGPLVLNGSPLSYWGGVEGSNPMRYRGGLLGGVWLNSFLSDLGNGHFDGANLVMNMENLNPANTYWSKYYHVYENVDTEEKRFLEFERWWGGFFMMTKEEIHFIVDSLFVGNRLERGKLKLDEEGHNVDIKNIKDPVVVFASGGDNITPPQQALNWIAKVYKTTDEIKRNNQVIIYLLHEDIGHLGIFVSTKVAKKEHKEILGTVEMFSYLSPGLYEMKIDETDEKNWDDHYKVSFEERDMQDILSLDDGFEDEADFLHVATISRNLDRYYNAYMNPVVSSVSNEKTAELLKQTHPLRLQRYLFSDLNPFMIPFKTAAKYVKKNRIEAPKENSFRQIEKSISDSISYALDMYRDMRDLSHEYCFKNLYGNPFIQSFYKESFKDNIWSEDHEKEEVRKTPEVSEARLLSKMDKGGFKEGLLRIMIAIASADEVIDKSEFIIAQSIARSHPKLNKLKPAEVREIAVEQSRLLQIDREKALKTLPRLIHYKRDRREALEIAEKIAHADSVVTKEEKEVIDKITSIMKI